MPSTGGVLQADDQVSSQNDVTDISIVLCTYNPDRAVLNRVLAHCLGQVTNKGYEIIVVDNNSSPPVSTELNPRIKLVREPRQGLVNARITGFKACKGQTILFVDDDNLIAADYMEQLRSLILEYPDVAVWGPGTVRLEFTSEPPGWIRKHFGFLFQEKSRQEIKYGKETGWPSYYPAGSGMAVTRDVFETYLRHFESGNFTATGRKGNTLSSGEDSQIVWTAVKTGKQAGTSPDLKLIHIIPASRLSLDYLSRLQFHIALSYCQSLSEIFPEQKQKLKPLSVAGELRLFLRVLGQSKLRPLLFYRKYKIDRAWFKGVKEWSRKA